ncbi:MAG: hypothetical protein JEY91_05875 [Spirochaetaceae bacterium]|nr:hypothetical protein [Spirochaetaceae bacterium]
MRSSFLYLIAAIAFFIAGFVFLLFTEDNIPMGAAFLILGAVDMALFATRKKKK